MSKLDKLIALVTTRQMAYKHVFNPENVFTEQVLKDLEKFCRGTSSAFHADPRVHALLEGRREVFMRICEQLKLDTPALIERFGGKVE